MHQTRQHKHIVKPSRYEKNAYRTGKQIHQAGVNDNHKTPNATATKIQTLIDGLPCMAHPDVSYYVFWNADPSIERSWLLGKPVGSP